MATRARAVDVLEADRRPFAPVPAAGPEWSRPPRPRRVRRMRPMKLVAGITALVVFGVTLGWLVNDEVRANDRYDQTRDSLTVTRHEIETASQELASVRRQLTLVIAQVGSDSTALAQDQSQLQAAQATLTTALANVSQQTSQIASLHTCLGGVEQALNALAVNNQASALLALSSVATSCTRATSGG
jgi:septal ring factor EnvC (AmiA/AmiB activator)